jgi:hypothetical protein
MARAESDLHGSTYRLTRKGANDKRAMCKKNGETARISTAYLKS